MKTIVTLLLALGFSAAAHADKSPLAGSYIVHTADCIVGGVPAAAVAPLKFDISADESEVRVTVQVHTEFAQSGVGTLTLEDIAVGDFAQVAMGGSTFRQAAVYSDNMNKLVYTEYDNAAANMPLRELRSTIFELNGGVLHITQTGDGVADRVCILTQAN